jgi:hypothetical protein
MTVEALLLHLMLSTGARPESAVRSRSTARVAANVEAAAEGPDNVPYREPDVGMHRVRLPRPGRDG